MLSITLWLTYKFFGNFSSGTTTTRTTTAPPTTTTGGTTTRAPTTTTRAPTTTTGTQGTTTPSNSLFSLNCDCVTEAMDLCTGINFPYFHAILRSVSSGYDRNTADTRGPLRN